MLNDEQIRTKLSYWMGELFEKDFHPDQVKIHIEKMSLKIATAKMKNLAITNDLFVNLCKQTENELKGT
jgi:hypothetical protein